MGIEIKIKRPRTEVWGNPVLIEYVSESDSARRNDANLQCRLGFDSVPLFSVQLVFQATLGLTINC